jgi:hypothetical protein
LWSGGFAQTALKTSGPQGADPASLGLARVSLAGPCGVDRLVLGADLLGLGIAMRALLARCSGESTGRLDVDWLGGSRGDGVARPTDSFQPIRPFRAPILKFSQRRGSPEILAVGELPHPVKSRESFASVNTRGHCFPSGVLAPASGCGRPARATTTRGRDLFRWIMAHARCGTGALALPVGCT